MSRGDDAHPDEHQACLEALRSGAATGIVTRASFRVGGRRSKSPRCAVPTPHYRAACVYHGTWRAAIEAAGFDYQLSADAPRMRDDEFMAWLRERAWLAR